MIKKFKKENFYGLYTTGANFKNSKKNFFDEKNIKLIEKQIKKNCSKMNLSKEDFKNKIIMNVGSGREALGFLQYNPKKIYHYDISEKNIQKFKKIIKDLKLEKKIISKKLDISKNKLPQNKFDMIYLHGIIQHVDYVNKAITNLSLSLKKEGFMWFYFYRPGSLNVLLGSLQRALLKKTNIDIFYKNIKKNHSLSFADDIMDDCFVPNRHLFYPKEYYRFLKENNCHIYGNTFLNNIDKKIDFNKFHESVVFFIKKMENNKNKDTKQLLRSGTDVDVLNKRIYSNDNIKIILNNLKKIDYSKQTLIYETVIKIAKIKKFITQRFYSKKQISKKELSICINKINNYINKLLHVI